MKNSCHAFCLVCLVVMLQACSESSKSPQDEIRLYIQSFVQAAENRSVKDVSDLIHGSYLDQNGYNKQRIGSLVRAYFFRHKNLNFFTKVEEIQLLADNEATVSLYVAMAGSVIADVDAIAALRAKIYQFELQLIKEEDWLLHHASWKPARVLDIE